MRIFRIACAVLLVLIALAVVPAAYLLVTGGLW